MSSFVQSGTCYQQVQPTVFIIYFTNKINSSFSLTFSLWRLQNNYAEGCYSTNYFLSIWSMFAPVFPILLLWLELSFSLLFLDRWFIFSTQRQWTRNRWIIIPWHSVRKRREGTLWRVCAKNLEKSLGCLHWIVLGILKIGQVSHLHTLLNLLKVGTMNTGSIKSSVAKNVFFAWLSMILLHRARSYTGFSFLPCLHHLWTCLGLLQGFAGVDPFTVLTL